MDATLELLPGEGETKTVTKTRTRKACEFCGKPAHFKHTFLLGNYRHNPASSAYGRDDCSWCEDQCRFVCIAHQKENTPPPGYESCSTFPATERFAHLFLEWTTVPAS